MVEKLAAASSEKPEKMVDKKGDKEVEYLEMGIFISEFKKK
jgi:hypothetical protein